MTVFLSDWFHFIGEFGETLARDFLALLPAEISARPEIAERITEYLTVRGDRSSDLAHPIRYLMKPLQNGRS